MYNLPLSLLRAEVSFFLLSMLVSSPACGSHAAALSALRIHPFYAADPKAVATLFLPSNSAFADLLATLKLSADELLADTVSRVGCAPARRALVQQVWGKALASWVRRPQAQCLPRLPCGPCTPARC